MSFVSGISGYAALASETVGAVCGVIDRTGIIGRELLDATRPVPGIAASHLLNVGDAVTARIFATAARFSPAGPFME